MIYERKPTIEQLRRIDEEKQAKAKLLQANQAQQNKQTDQDLINALLLQKIAELEKKLAEQNSYGDSGDVIS